MVGLNGSDKKGSLFLFLVILFTDRVYVYFLGVLLFAVYLLVTFASAFSVIFAWNASNTSGHTKKGVHHLINLLAHIIDEFPSNDQRDDTGSFWSW